MGIDVGFRTDPPDLAPADCWTRSDGRRFVRLLCRPRCRALLEEYVGRSLGACLAWAEAVPSARFLRAEAALTDEEITSEQARCLSANEAAWHPPEAVAEQLDELLVRLPVTPPEQWGQDDDSTFYLYYELASELGDDYVFGGLIRDLSDFRAAVELARSAGAAGVRLEEW